MEIVLAAMIAAVPATIAALASWRSAHKADVNTRTSNGTTLGQLAEKVERQNRAQTRAVAGVLVEIAKVDEKLDAHVVEHAGR